MKLDINFLPIYEKKINELEHELSHLQKIAKCTAPKSDVKSFSEALKKLMATIDNFPQM